MKKSVKLNFASKSSLIREVAGKAGFTLAEVLITLTVIGVVAALTLPSVIQSFQKHVFYTQFRKAATQLENALKLYSVDNGCEGDISNCLSGDHYFLWQENNFVDNFSKYFKVSQLINNNNYEEVCKGSPLKSGFNTDNIWLDNECIRDLGPDSTSHAFITTDGMLFNFATDFGAGSGSLVDVNGPNKGPNALGRDVFVFYLNKASKSGIFWGGNEAQYGYSSRDESCTKDHGDGCAAKLLREGKMNY